MVLPHMSPTHRTLCTPHYLRKAQTPIRTLTLTRAARRRRIVITSPLSPSQTGASSVDVSGTYINVDPQTLSMSPHAISDTTGTFNGSAALQPNSTTTITVTGRSRAGESGAASIDVQNAAG